MTLVRCFCACVAVYVSLIFHVVCQQGKWTLFFFSRWSLSALCVSLRLGVIDWGPVIPASARMGSPGTREMKYCKQLRKHCQNRWHQKLEMLNLAHDSLWKRTLRIQKCFLWREKQKPLKIMLSPRRWDGWEVCPRGLDGEGYAPPPRIVETGRGLLSDFCVDEVI
jgi:hypothetical protein